MSTPRKLVVIQLDSADSTFIQSNIGHLPNLSRVFAKGGFNPLEQKLHTGEPGTTFNTGKEPPEHGVYFQLQWNPAAMRLESLSADWIGDLTPFWRKPPFSSMKGIVLDPYLTFAGAVDGHIEVLGWSSHSSIEPYQCNDSAEQRRIASDYGINPIGNETQLKKGPKARAVERDRMIASAAARGRLLCDLIARHDWDFLYATFGETHRAGHVLWPAQGETPQDAIMDVFKAVDAALGSFLDSVPDDAHVVVFAANGMGHQSSQSHFCRPMLEKALQVMGYALAEHAAKPGAIAWLRKTIPARLQWEIRHHVPLWLRDKIVAREYAEGIVPGKSVAFPLRSDNNGYWRLLVKGREAEGTLEVSEALRLCDDFAEFILSYRTLDGEPLVHDVTFPSQSLGARSHFLPDIMASWNPDIGQVAEARHPKHGVIRAEPDRGRTGSHRFRGFYSHVGEVSSPLPQPRHVADLAGYLEALANSQR